MSRLPQGPEGLRGEQQGSAGGQKVQFGQGNELFIKHNRIKHDKIKFKRFFLTI